MRIYILDYTIKSYALECRFWQPDPKAHDYRRLSIMVGLKWL